MPIDGSDFVTDHILVCSENSDGSFIPLLGSKSLPYDICGLFHLDFTIEKLLRSSGCHQHIEGLSKILEECRLSQRRISYFSSWTILPSVRKDLELVQTLKEIYAATTVLHHQEQNISDLLGLGLPKFHTEEFFFKWGFEKVELPRPEEEKLRLSSFGGIDAVFMHLKSYSDYALGMAKKYQNLWNSRINLGITVRDLNNQKIKIAA
jgi:hypothetical protein